MQNEKENIDILFKSLLENAEEEVPACVWDAVSAGLGSQKVRPMAIWWRRAAVGMAAAAVLALGVFIWQRNDSSLINDTDALAEKPEQSQTSEAPDIQVLASGAEILLADAAPQGGHKAAGSIAGVGNEIALMTEDSNSGNDVTAISGTEGDNSSNIESKVPETEPANEVISEENVAIAEKDIANSAESAAEAFVRMEWEDSMKDKESGISFSIGGDVQNNGNPHSASGIGMKHSAGYVSPTTTTVEQVSKESTYSVPLSVGLGVQIPFAKRWSVGTGLNYSMMERTFTGLYTEIAGGVKTKVINSDIRHSIHYIGIPINIYFNVLNNKNIDFYTFAGCSVEKAIVNNYRILHAPEKINYSAPVKGIQFSAAIGFGVEFRLAEHLGLYIDPGLRYYFNGDQPTSIRTQQPLMMSFEIGLRANL